MMTLQRSRFDCHIMLFLRISVSYLFLLILTIINVGRAYWHPLTILFHFSTNICTVTQQRNPAAPVLPRGAPRHALEADPVAPGSAMFRKAR